MACRFSPRLWCLCTFCCLLFSTYSQADAATQNSGNHTNYKMKAMYTYHFANFVQWPDSQPVSIRFCTLGRDSVTVTLQQLINKKNQTNTPASITALNNIDDAIGRCEILYITANRSRLLKKIPLYAGMLTVSDSQHFLQNGGMIELRSVTKRVKPAIALDNVKRGQLTISSQLLRIALLPSDLTGGVRE